MLEYRRYGKIKSYHTPWFKQEILSKDICVRTAEFRPFFAFLSIIQNFSLGRLCKALHNRPNEKFKKEQTFNGKGVKFERIRRITGYLVGTVDRWNDAKKRS